jgi:hypothetical protein
MYPSASVAVLDGGSFCRQMDGIILVALWLVALVSSLAINQSSSHSQLRILFVVVSPSGHRRRNYNNDNIRTHAFF